MTMTPAFSVTRQIGIDAGHRVTNHASKCRNLHGHRYTIEVSCNGPLVTAGSEEGMVTDFGELKNVMMEVIDRPCDHGTMLWVKDPLLDGVDWAYKGKLSDAVAWINAQGFLETVWWAGKLYLLPFVPTAENLARHWHDRVQECLTSKGLPISVSRVRVWETPNCFADYPAAWL